MQNEKSSSSSISKRFFWFSVSNEYAAAAYPSVQHVVDVRVGDVAVDAQLRPLTGRDVQVGGVPLDHLLEERAKIEAEGAGLWLIRRGAVMRTSL